MTQRWAQCVGHCLLLVCTLEFDPGQRQLSDALPASNRRVESQSMKPQYFWIAVLDFYILSSKEVLH